MVNTKDKSRLLDYSKVRAEEKLKGITPPEPPISDIPEVDVELPKNEPPKVGPEGIKVERDIPNIEKEFKVSKDPHLARMPEKLDPKFMTKVQKFGPKVLGHAKVAGIDMLTSPEETVSAEDELDAITENEMKDAEARQYAKTKAMHEGKKKAAIPADLPKSPKQKEANLKSDVESLAKKTLSPRKKTTVVWKKGDTSDEYDVDHPTDMSDDEIIAIIKRQMMKDE
jgi:hypothetical protein